MPIGCSCFVGKAAAAHAAPVFQYFRSILHHLTVFTQNLEQTFTGGNLSSDAGILLLKEFYHKLGVDSLAKETFLTTDLGHYRIHKDHENLLQMLYQITAAYFQDDHADALRHDSVLTAAVEKSSLAFQPTLSRLPSASGSCYRARSGLSPPSYRPCRAHNVKRGCTSIPALF